MTGPAVLEGRGLTRIYVIVKRPYRGGVGAALPIVNYYSKNGRAFGAPPLYYNHCVGARHFGGQGPNAEGSRLRARPRIYVIQ